MGYLCLLIKYMNRFVSILLGFISYFAFCNQILAQSQIVFDLSELNLSSNDTIATLTSDTVSLTITTDADTYWSFPDSGLEVDISGLDVLGRNGAVMNFEFSEDIIFNGFDIRSIQAADGSESLSFAIGAQTVATLTGLAQGDIGERNFNPSFRLNAGQKLKMTVSNSTDAAADLKFLYWDSLTVETIPEPGSYALALGLAGSLLIARRRKHELKTR